MIGFLIRYHRPSGAGELWQFHGEDGPERALEQRFVLEREREREDWEIATLESDSLETIRHTHSRYFAGPMRVVA